MTRTYSEQAQRALNTTPALRVQPGNWDTPLRRYRATINLSSQVEGDDVVLFLVGPRRLFAYGVVNTSEDIEGRMAIGIEGEPEKYARARSIPSENRPWFFGEVDEVGSPEGTGLTAETILLTVDNGVLPESGRLVVDMYFTG
jgi:hypothetical protein